MLLNEVKRTIEAPRDGALRAPYAQHSAPISGRRMIWFKPYRFSFPAGASRPELSLSRAFVRHGVWYRYKGEFVKVWVPSRLDFQGYINPVFTGRLLRQADGQIILRGRFRPSWIVLFATICGLFMVLMGVWTQGQTPGFVSAEQLAPLLISLCAVGVMWWYSILRSRTILGALAEATETWDVPH